MSTLHSDSLDITAETRRLLDGLRDRILNAAARPEELKRLKQEVVDSLVQLGARPRAAKDAVGAQLGRGERPAGRAELLAKEGGIWAHAASAGTGTDPWSLRKAP